MELQTLNKDWVVIGSDLSVDQRKYIETNIIENIVGENVSFKVIEIPKNSNLALVAPQLCTVVNCHNDLVSNLKKLVKHFTPSFEAAGPQGISELARLNALIEKAEQVG